MTLAELSGATGISVSTLSRLEAGQRKPTLELLLPIARAHQIPIDDLVGPAAEDPRVRGEADPARQHADGAAHPPTGGLQAYKITIPAGRGGVRRSRRPTTATTGSTCSAAGCGWCSASTTWSSSRGRPPSSTPGAALVRRRRRARGGDPVDLQPRGGADARPRGRPGADRTGLLAPATT